jgi:hypothetical protein
MKMKKEKEKKVWYNKTVDKKKQSGIFSSKG